jgi:hypothetical protein
VDEQIVRFYDQVASDYYLSNSGPLGGYAQHMR